ncbi:BRM1L protein, partial [Polyodon spathula]|nr:BRM1L protein [Polyodon spathula]
MDDEDCERRRIECLDEMSDLEKQFMGLKEKLFEERLNQVKAKLEEVIAGKAAEYIEPVAALQKNMKIRTEVAEWWNDKLRSKKSTRRCDPTKPEKKRKPVLVSGILSLRRNVTEYIAGGHSTLVPARAVIATVMQSVGNTLSGPYIVYMLQDISILEDWTAIKKAKATVLPVKKKSETAKQDSVQYSAKCEDGKLYYEGECYSKGQVILLEIRDDPPSQAVITAVSTGEVWLRRTDGSKTKIYVSQLQKGKYTIRKA